MLGTGQLLPPGCSTDCPQFLEYSDWSSCCALSSVTGTILHFPHPSRLLQDYDPRWVEALDMIRDGVFGDVDYFKDLVDSVNDVPKSGNDW